MDKQMTLNGKGSPLVSTRSTRRDLAGIALAVTAVAAAGLWAALLRTADPSGITDLGLIAVLPPLGYAALALLIVSFTLAVRREKISNPLLLLHVVLLIICLYGAAYLVEGQPRTAVAWKLSGIMDQVMDHGAVDPARDAFQNWPGFFILVAFLTSAAGLESPLALAGWAPVGFSLLYLGPLVLLLRAATRNRRLVWLGVWFFYLSNWIGQDYLAPQALGYFYYLLVLGVLLNWFQSDAATLEATTNKLRFLPKRLAKALKPWLGAEPAGDRFIGRGRPQAGLLLVLGTYMVVMAPSHQLSPVALLASITALVVFGRISPRGLPIFLGVLVLAYISYMTVPYLDGHLENFTEPFGDLGSNVNENVIARLRGSPEHVLVVVFRIYASLVIWLIAGVGIIRRQRHGFRDTSFLLLAGVPFGLLALQTYGGELLLRTFLLSLPFVAFFMGGLLGPRPRTKLPPAASIGLIALSAVLGTSFFLTRYGNERMDYFTANEVEAVRYLYAHAEPGSQFVAGSSSLPWRYEGYNVYRYTTIERTVRTNDMETLMDTMQRRGVPRSYLVLTRSQQAAGELYIGWELGAWERFVRTVSESPDFQLVYSNPDAKIFILAEQAASIQP